MGAWVAQSAFVCLRLRHDPRVLGSSPVAGSLLSGESAYPSPSALTLHPPSPANATPLVLSLSQINK